MDLGLKEVTFEGEKEAAIKMAITKAYPKLV